MDSYRPLNESYLSIYETDAGKKIYAETLACVQDQFPEYLKEIQGTADGANIPFYKVSNSINQIYSACVRTCMRIATNYIYIITYIYISLFA